MKIIISLILALAQVFGFFQAALLRGSPLMEGGERLAYGSGKSQNPERLRHERRRCFRQLRQPLPYRSPKRRFHIFPTLG